MAEPVLKKKQGDLVDEAKHCFLFPVSPHFSTLSKLVPALKHWPWCARWLSCSRTRADIR